MSRDSRKPATAASDDSAAAAPPPPPPQSSSTATDNIATWSNPDTRPAGGGPTPTGRPTVIDAAKTIKWGDFLEVYKMPCAREGWLVGIGAGAAGGALRFILGAPVGKAANLAVGIWFAGSLAGFEYCKYNLRQSKANMKRVVEVWGEKQRDDQLRQQQAARKAAQDRAKAEADAKEAEARRRRWYKFW